MHELCAKAVVLAVEDESVRRTWPSTMDWPVLFSALYMPRRPAAKRGGDDYRRTVVLDCRSKGGKPSRPFSEEQDEEVAVLALQRRA